MPDPLHDEIEGGEEMIFRHYRTEKNGSITICGEVVKDQAFAIGVAFCSPKEKQFSKKVGRYIAEGRLRSFLVKREATFGRGWCLVYKDDISKTKSHIERLLPEVKGPSWYSRFLEEWKSFARAKNQAAIASGGSINA